MAQAPSTEGPVSGSKPPPEAHEQDALRRKYEKTIEKMEKHISVAQDGTVSLDVKSAADIQVDSDVFDNLQKSLQHTNMLIQTKQLRPGQVRLQTTIGQMEPHVKALMTQPPIRTAGACAELAWVEQYWWGVKWHLNECATQGVIAMVQVEAGATAIFAAFAAWVGGPAGPLVGLVSGIVAAVLQLGAAFIQWRDSTCGNQGIVISVPWTLVGTWFWCS